MEIKRLEQRKRDLLEELEQTENQLTHKRKELETTRGSVQRVLLACANDRPKQVISKLKKSGGRSSPQLSNRRLSDCSSLDGDADSDIMTSPTPEREYTEDPLEEEYDTLPHKNILLSTSLISCDPNLLLSIYRLYLTTST